MDLNSDNYYNGCTYDKKFLFLPKKIEGRWYWLRTVTLRRKWEIILTGKFATKRLVKEEYIL